MAVGGRLVLIWLLAAAPLWSAAADPYGDPGPHGIRILEEVWADDARARDVPVRIYRPHGIEDPPVVIVSHGLGGSRRGLAYLGRHWASHGYLSVHLQHAGSDEYVWRDVPVGRRGAALARAANPLTATQRPVDVSFALDEVARRFGLAVDGRSAVAGHSFGAYTAIASAGAVFSGAAFGDPRLAAAIALSPPSMRTATFDAVAIPTLHATGSRDDGVVAEYGPELRRSAFDGIDGPPKYFLWFDGADHMVFGGAPRGPRNDALDAHIEGRVLAATTAFLAAYVRKDPAARAWLDGTFAATLGPEDRLER